MERESRNDAALRRWREVTRGWNRRGLRFALVLAIPLYPIFGILDFVSLPPRWFTLALALRLMVSAIGAIFLFLLDHPRSGRWLIPMSATYTLIAGLGISWLTFLTGGFDSTYASGLNIVMLAAGMLFVWPHRVSLGVYSVLILSFLIPSVLIFEPEIIVRAFESTFFIVATAGILLVAQAYRQSSLRLESDAGLRVEQLSEDLKVANNHLAELARVDALTRVGNRRAFDERLDEEWSRTVRTGAEMSVLLLDVDNFKDFNDAFGHPTGDMCLKQLAAAARSTLARPGDFVARYGGEEFAVILPGTNTRGARRVSEKILRAVRDLEIPHSESANHDLVTVSIGGASTRGTELADASELIREVDSALYQAKEAGRNTVQIREFSRARVRERS